MHRAGAASRRYNNVPPRFRGLPTAMKTTEKATPEEVEAMFAELREGRRQHWVQILWRVLLVELVLFGLLLFANGEPSWT